MAALHRFNAIYSPTEDRILLQATGEDWTQNFWITRHVLIMLGSVCNALLEKHYTTVAQMARGSLSYVGDFAQFGQEAAYSDNPPRKCSEIDEIKETPLLVYEIRYQSLDKGCFAILLSDKDGRAHGYQLQESLLQALINLLQAQADQARWNIRLRPTASTSNIGLDRGSTSYH